MSKEPTGLTPPSTNITHSARAVVQRYTKDELELENFELVAIVLELLDTHKLWDTDGTYTFTNGERWAEFKPEGDEDEH